jgi:parallel beta-helix repeat protein
MTNVYLSSCLGFLRSRHVGRLSRLPLAAGILGLGLLTSASAQTSVRSFGAHCNGSDDSGAINAALQSLSNGSTLLLDCNLGVGPSYLKLQNKQGVTLDGSGGSLTSLSGNYDHVLLLVEACNNCTIRNLNINANNSGVEGIYVRYSNNTTLDHNTVSNIVEPGLSGIFAQANNGNHYTNNTVFNSTGPALNGPRGIWLGSADPSLLERNPTVNNNYVHDVAATGIVLQTVTSSASGNLVERAAGACIKIEATPGQGGQVTIQGNTLRNCLYHGVQINQADIPVYVRNNMITNNSGAGIYSTYQGFPNGDISGNTISGNSDANIHLYNAINVTIQNNQITGGGNGIVFEAQPWSTLGGVQVNSNTISGANADGIAVWGRGGSLNGLSVSNNSIMNNSRYGMAMDETNAGGITNVSLNNNCFANNGAGSLLDARASNHLSVATSSGCGQAGSGASGGSSGPSGQSSTSSSSSSTSSSSSSSGGGSFTPIRVNCGGGQYTDLSGLTWSSDTGSSGGSTYSTSASISNSSSPTLYQSHRWNRGSLDYSFQVPNGTYTVTLKFAEIYWRNPGARVFSVWINNQQVLGNFDVFAAGGANNAVDRSFQVQSSGQVAIHMTASADAPMVSGIEIK